MPDLSRSQLALYGALAVVLLLIGARAVRGETGGSAGFSGSGASAYDASGSGGSSGGAFAVGSGGGDVVVDVTGAVARAGVYRLPAGSRVTDAVERPGGALPGAAVDAVNLAARLADGQQVVIPEAAAAGTTTGAGAGVEAEGPVSLGTATVDDLDTIEGIGPVTAQDIIDFRDQHGGLASVEQLDQVSGIG